MDVSYSQRWRRWRYPMDPKNINIGWLGIQDRKSVSSVRKINYHDYKMACGMIYIYKNYVFSHNNTTAAVHNRSTTLFLENILRIISILLSVYTFLLSKIFLLRKFQFSNIFPCTYYTGTSVHHACSHLSLSKDKEHEN